MSSAFDGTGFLELDPWRRQAHDAVGAPIDDLCADLTLIDEGIRLRRRHFDSEGAAVERGFFDDLLKLQERVTVHLAERVATFTAEETAPIADRLDRALGTDRSHLDRLLTRAKPAWVTALQLERLRGDLTWRDQVLHSCLGRTPPHPSYQARAALDVAMQLAVTPTASDLAILREEVEKEALSARRRLTETRAAAELAFAKEATDLADAWRQRFVLSRLQADLEAGPSAGAKETPGVLSAQREETVKTAFEALGEAEHAERVGRWRRVQEVASAGLVETAALADTVKPQHALRLLELNVQDARRLRKQFDAERQRTVAEGLRKLDRRFRGSESAARNRLQERQLEERQKAFFGARLFRWWESLLLILVLLIVVLLLIETVLVRAGLATPRMLEAFAYSDLVICSVFLADFALRLALVEDRLRYFRRHFIVDFLAAIPFGYIAWFAGTATGAAAAAKAEYLELVRLLRLLRLQSLQPILRIGRLALFAARFADGLVNRYAKAFNRNIVLWELSPTRNSDQRTADKLSFLRDLTMRRFNLAAGSLNDAERLNLARALLVDLEARIDHLPSGEFPEQTSLDVDGGTALVEDVIAELVTITPERLNEQMGPAFSESVARFVRLFDLPGVRALPGLRDLTALRGRGAGETAAAAVNKAGRLLQRVVDLGNYFADLRGTVSPPILVDRVGVAIVAATAGPARRLFWLLLLFLATYGFALLMPLPQFIDDWLGKVLRPLTGFVAAVGALCIVPLGIGLWLKRVARQASEFGERVVEAQFIGQTKGLKRQRRQEDSRLLYERAVGPELALRSGDDATRGDAVPRVELLEVDERWGGRKFHERELAFVRGVELMYQEFLDGSPFHRSDAKTATQLLGNLAVLNLRRTNPRQFRAERRRWEALDLNKSPGLFWGPFLWFSYINRLLSQETATLMLDFNLNAQPLERLPSLPKAERDAYRAWLARRKRVRLEEIAEIEPYSPLADEDRQHQADARTRREPLYDNVVFSALDILIDDPARDAQIRVQYGEEVAELLRRDRRELIRKVFRTFPLHELPRERRTLNPLQLYQRYAADGRILLLPFRVIWWLVRGTGRLGPAAYRSVWKLLRPAVESTDQVPVDSYAVAVRKIHRMRKPMFLTALWLRANFDVEYLGLRLPGVPTESEATSPLERDLDFIEASHFDRLNAERVRVRRAAQLRTFNEALGELGLDFEGLADRLKADFPPLVERRGEVVRALVAAGMADYDDVRSLAAAVSGLRALLAHAADARNNLSVLPPWVGRYALDQKPARGFWFRGRGVRRVVRLPCFPAYELWQQRRIRYAIRVHRRVTGPWVDVLLAEGGADPMATLEERLLDIIRRVDLWSDQIVTLRTLQTMTILDVDHYCRFVWELGRYSDLGETEAPQAPTGPAVPRYSRNGAGGVPDEAETLTALE